MSTLTQQAQKHNLQKIWQKKSSGEKKGNLEILTEDIFTIMHFEQHDSFLVSCCNSMVKNKRYPV